MTTCPVYRTPPWVDTVYRAADWPGVTLASVDLAILEGVEIVRHERALALEAQQPKK